MEQISKKISSQKAYKPLLIAGLILIITLFSINLIFAQSTKLSDKLSEFSITGMKINEMKVDGIAVTDLSSKNSNHELVTEYKKLSNNAIEQDIYLKNNKLTKDFSLSTLIEIDYSQIRWNGMRYNITEEPIIFKSFNNRFGNLTTPSIFMDDKYNKKIDYKDWSEKGGYAIAYKLNNKYYIELKMDKLNIKSGENYYIDPGYFNQTDGIPVSRFGGVSPYGFTGNGTDWWITDGSLDIVWHLNNTGGYINNFSTTTFGAINPTGVHFNGSNFWLANDGAYPINDTIYYLNRTGGYISNFSINSLFNNVQEIWSNNTNIFILNYAGLGKIYNFLINGSLSNVVNSSFLGTNNGVGLESMINNELMVTSLGYEDLRIMDFKGTITQPSYNLNKFGITTSLGIYANNSNIWIIDDTDKFIYHLIYTPLAFINNSETYNLETYDSTLEYFALNISYDSYYYSIANAYLNYNGTSYLGDKTTIGDYTIFSKDLNIPIIDGTVKNITFFWTVELTNITSTYYYNHTLHNQTVKSSTFNASSCSTKFLNMTSFNEITLNRINPFDIKGTIEYSTSIGGIRQIINFTNNSISEKNICFSTNTTYYLNGLIEYSNNSFYPKNYYFLDYPVSNVTKHLKLYLLPIASSTSFIIQVQDTNLIALQNYYASIFRYDAGDETPYLVQTIKTDINGQGVAFLEVEKVDYLFAIYNTTGSLVYTSEKQRAIPQTTPYTLTFTVGLELPNPIFYLSNITNFTYSINYDNDTMSLMYIYDDAGSDFISTNLIVYKFNLNGTDSVICNKENTHSSGIILCELWGNSTGSYYAVAYLNRGTNIFVDRYLFEIESFSGSIGLLGIFGAFLILLVCAFLFTWNEVAGIVALNMGIIFINLIGLVHFGGVAITAIIAVSILILIVLERG